MKHDFIDRYSKLDSPVHERDARAKAIALFAIIIACVTTPPAAWFAFCIYAGLVVLITVASHVPFRYLLTRMLIVLPFILVVAVFVPFMHGGEPAARWGWLTISQSGLLVLWNVAAKSLISVSCVILLTSTTPFNDLMRGFERLHVPAFFTTVTSFMYRYIFIIVDEAERMKRARDSRNYKGRWIWQAKVLGYMIASLFLRSQERAEHVYNAMCARGFDGTYPRWRDRKMSATDYTFVVMIVAVVLAGRIAVLWT
ncbi:MAG: cobalt ECF transporter T component CbiQ [Candidatus Geothermincolia bacterium]